MNLDERKHRGEMVCQELERGQRQTSEGNDTLKMGE